jgi:hypothetical protein
MVSETRFPQRRKQSKLSRSKLKKMRKSPNRENGDFLQVMLVMARKKNADAFFPA